MTFFKFNHPPKTNLAVLINLYYKYVNKLQDLKLSKSIHYNNNIGHNS